MMKKVFILLISVLSLSAMEPLVSGEWVLKHSNDTNLVILDVSSEDAFNDGHIPNAVQSGLKKWREAKGKSAYKIRPTKDIELEIRRLGINHDSNVVVYSHNLNPIDLLTAPYIVWALEYFGLQNVAMLDAGMKSYTEAGGKLTDKTITPQEGNFKANINSTMIIDMENVKKSIGKIKMVDSRPAKYYFGTDRQAILKRAGHIDEAKSYSWQYSLNKNNSLKTKAILSETLEKGLGLNKNEDLIIYCTGGLEAAMNYFVFHKVLNFKKATLYDSSMLEWANRDDTPMTKYRWE